MIPDTSEHWCILRSMSASRFIPLSAAQLGSLNVLVHDDITVLDSSALSGEHAPVATEILGETQPAVSVRPASECQPGQCPGMWWAKTDKLLCMMEVDGTQVRVQIAELDSSGEQPLYRNTASAVGNLERKGFHVTGDEKAVEVLATSGLSVIEAAHLQMTRPQLDDSAPVLDASEAASSGHSL